MSRQEHAMVTGGIQLSLSKERKLTSGVDQMDAFRKEKMIVLVPEKI